MAKSMKTLPQAVTFAHRKSIKNAPHPCLKIEVPQYFLCPISLEIMKDLVIISTGIIYYQDNIECWIFSQGSAIYPVMCLPLCQSEDFIPNIILHRLIKAEEPLYHLW